MVMISEIACGKAGRPWPSYWEGHGIRGKREMGKFPEHFRFVESDIQAALIRCVLELSRPLFVCSCINGSTALLLGLGRLFLISRSCTQLVGLLGRGISPLQGLCLHTGQHKHRENTQTSMPRVGFESTISSLRGRREFIP
jgi:hypothetical protein